MNLGFRILDDAYIDRFELGLVQISVWHKNEDNLQKVKRLSQRLRKMGRRFIVHPSWLYLSETRGEVRKYYLDVLKQYAHLSDLGLIVHDETLPWGGRLAGEFSDAYASALDELERICPVSIENASDSHEAIWFWKNFAHSIVFDIGHFESAGMDCFEVIDRCKEDLAQKLDYVHLHRNNGRKEIGITDHWPMVDGCIELSILKHILEVKPDVKVILEVDGEQDIRNSIQVITSYS